MKNRYIIAFFLSAIILLVMLVGYGIYVNYASSAHVAKMASSQYIRVVGAEAAYRDIHPTIELSAINLYSAKMSDVRFQIGGTISNIFVKLGERVRAGQLLGEVTNQELAAQILQAEGKISAAEANAVRWESTRIRYQNLEKRDAISRQQVEEAVGSAKAAAGELASARAYRDEVATRLQYQRITSPYDGYVLKIYQAPGAVVRGGDELFLIGELSSLFFNSKITSMELEQLRQMQDGLKLAVKRSEFRGGTNLSGLATSNAGQVIDFDVQISEVAHEQNSGLLYRNAVFHVSNPAGLLEPGTYHQVKVYRSSSRRVLAIPKEAVSTEEQPSVLVVLADSRLEKRPVKTGVKDENYIEIVDGLKEKDIVVIAGRDGSELEPGTKVQVVQR